MIRRPFLLVASLIIVVTLVGLAQADPSADADENPNAEKAATLVSHLETLAKHIEQAGDDCDALTTSIEAFVEAHGDEVRTLTVEISALPENEQAALKGEYDTRMKAVGETIVAGLTKCSDHKGTMEAFSKLDTANPNARTDAAPSAEDGAKTPTNTDSSIGDAEATAAVTAVVKHLSSLGEKMAAHHDDCSAMATAINDFVDAEGESYTKQVKAVEALSDADLQALEQEHKTQLEAAMRQIINGAMACSGSADVEAALSRLQL